ncbi:MAG: hypothetical protein ACOZB3_10135 [Calditrichota bacterium]
MKPTAVDLDTLKQFARGELSTKQFLAVYRDAGDLLELLQKHLHPGEYVTSIAEWPVTPTRKQIRQYANLKNLMLATPFILVGGASFMFASPFAILYTGVVLAVLFLAVAAYLLVRRSRARRSRQGRSVLTVTSRRIMRIWLDGSGDVQSWLLHTEGKSHEPMEPVPETIQLLLQLDLGKVSLN